jgi:hypothetical protein
MEINPEAWNGIGPDLRKIVESILVMNPKSRPRAKDLVNLPYF